jgi:hypothetical protein
VSAPSRKGKRNPRRKAGKAIPKRTKRKLSFRIVIDAQEMLVAYTPEYFSGMGHFEFKSPRKPARRIPVSATGYLSHYAPMDEIASASSPKDFAREIALAIIQRDRKAPKGFDDARQLSLF